MPNGEAYATYPSLRERVVFVTGGATGIGAEIVRQFAAQGAHTAFVDIAEPASAALASEVADTGHHRPSYDIVDVRDVEKLRAAMRGIAARIGPISVLVNNAAVDARHRIDDVEPHDWDDRMAVNLRHYVFATQAALGSMRALGRGSIINLGTVATHSDFAGMPGYVASKAAIEGLTRTLARDLGPDRIRVNCVSPGWVMTERQLRMAVTDEVKDRILRAQSLPDLVVPADVARLVLWLASDDSAMCTGAQWSVDAGWN